MYTCISHVYVCQSCIYVLGMSILHVSAIFRLDFGNVQTVWYALVFHLFSVFLLWLLLSLCICLNFVSYFCFHKCLYRRNIFLLSVIHVTDGHREHLITLNCFIKAKIVCGRYFKFKSAQNTQNHLRNIRSDKFS